MVFWVPSAPSAQLNGDNLYFYFFILLMLLLWLLLLLIKIKCRFPIALEFRGDHEVHVPAGPGAPAWEP